MKLRNIIRLIMPLCLLLSIGVFAQNTKADKKKAKSEQLKSLIDSREYTFQAQSATAMGGRTRQLTSTYTLKVHGDSLLVADLPYFGRAYSATPGDTNGGINFKSTTFEYESNDVKKGGWLIVITPKSEKNATKMQLSVSADGYTTLQVTSNYRSIISFYGTIVQNSKR